MQVAQEQPVCLPNVEWWEKREFAEIELPEFPMEFRLIYQGPLLAVTDRDARIAHKHEIRKKIHRQLKELWKTHYALQHLPDVTQHLYDDKTKTEWHWSRLDELSKAYTRGGFCFAPLICRYYGLVCSLEILYLRKGIPGKVIRGGDLDNCMKTLLDALRIPGEKELPSDAKPNDSEHPFFCLMEDDALVTQIKITTDRLLVPQDESGDELVETAEGEAGCNHPDNKVYLVIDVRTLVADPTRTYVEFSL